MTNVSKGDKVLLSFSYCEECAACKSGHPSYCHTFNDRNFGGKRHNGTAAASIAAGKDGQEKIPLHSTFFGQSSFARNALVHRTSLVKVPPETDLALFAPLGCGIQTGAGAIINTLDSKPGSAVAVFGVGSVGLSAVMAAAKIRKARTVIAIDRHTSRLELAKRLGATHAILAAPGTNVAAEILKICPPLGVDSALDTTGVPAVIETMISALTAKGRSASVGAPGPGVRVSIEIMDHLVLGRSYMGCVEGDSVPSEVRISIPQSFALLLTSTSATQFVPYLIERHAKGELPLEEFITYYPLSEYKKAFDDSLDGTTVKAVLKWE